MAKALCRWFNFWVAVFTSGYSIISTASVATAFRMTPPAAASTTSRSPAVRCQSLQELSATGSSSNADSHDHHDDAPFLLGYVTDVEGNWDYFLSYVHHSHVLKVEELTPTSLTLTLKDPSRHYFVYGGDAVDKGPGDIRLVRALVDLQRRHPDRVHLLVGNRDLNKLRFTAELADDDVQRPLQDIPPPHWDPTAPRLIDYLKKEQAQTQSTQEEPVSIESLNTRVNRLHYMLQHTLGCPQTFDFRRQELAILRNVAPSRISDQDIVDSFLHEIHHEEGSLRQYLQCAKVAVVIGNTLFCHGAVDQETMGFVPRRDTKFENPPSQPPADRIIHDSLIEWVDALNDFLQWGLDDHRQRPYWNAQRTSRGGECLMALQNRPAMWGRSIVSNCYGDGGCITTDHAMQHRSDPDRVARQDHDPLVFEGVCSDPYDQTVATWLQQHGIQRVVVGHRPTGDCPAVLGAVHTGVEIVSGDTSFSDTTATDNRGAAMSVIELVGASENDNQLQIRGRLKDEAWHQSHFSRLHPEGVDDTVGDVCLGQPWEDGWWVKAGVDTDDSYHLTRGKGRHVEYKRVPKHQLSS